MTAARVRWGWVLLALGSVILVLGWLGPQVATSGVALVTAAAFLRDSRHRRFLVRALAVSFVGTAVVMVSYWLTMAGVWGIGEGTGRSTWWVIPIVGLYYLGWVMGVVGTVLLYREAVAARRVRMVR